MCLCDLPSSSPPFSLTDHSPAMSPGWEVGFASSASTAFNASHSASPAYLYGLPSADNLRIDDLLDFTNHGDIFLSSSSATDQSHLLPPPDPSSFPADDSSHLYSLPSSTSFPDDLYIPSEEVAELEWLSRFVDDSFSDVPPPVYTTISNQHQHQHQQLNQQHGVEQCSAPGRARSKRSKANSWSMAPSQSSSPSTSSSSSDFSLNAGKRNNSIIDHGNNTRSIGSKGKNSGAGGGGDAGGVRRCTHCASEKTPQWRTGPLGPKTLCNACGVRYKSGRLVPEYRPAASPTFVLTQHSNSHRKVLELRRQKELHLIRHDNGAAAAAAGELLFHDYEVC